MVCIQTITFSSVDVETQSSVVRKCIKHSILADILPHKLMPILLSECTRIHLLTPKNHKKLGEAPLISPPPEPPLPIPPPPPRPFSKFWQIDPSLRSRPPPRSVFPGPAEGATLPSGHAMPSRPLQGQGQVKTTYHQPVGVGISKVYYEPHISVKLAIKQPLES